MTKSDLGLRVVCVEGSVSSIDGGVALSAWRGVVSAFSLDDGMRLWTNEWARPFSKIVGGFVHAVSWADETPQVNVLDARTGLVERIVWLRGLEQAEGIGLIEVVDGAYFVAVDAAVQRRSLDGALLAQGAAPGPVQSWAFSASSVCVVSDGGSVTAFERDTLSQRWTRGALYDASILAAGEVFIVSSLGGYPDGAAAIAIDAVTGEERWSNAVFDAALAVDGDLVLACGVRAWLGALDLSTGEPRWQVRTRGTPLAAARVAVGFAVLTTECLIILDRDGVERAGWEVSAPFSLAASSAVIVCGARRVGDPIERSTFRGGARSLGALPEITDIEPMEGRAVFAPSHSGLEEVRAVLREIEDLDEAWEALATRGFIPPAWVDDPSRRFEEKRVSLARPWSRGAMLAFACDVDGVTRVESLWREAQRRLSRWEAPDETCRWGSARAFGLWGPEQILTLPMLSASQRMAEVLEASALTRIESSVSAALGVGAGYDVKRAVLIAETEWRAAALAGADFDDDENPFAPLREILALGYAFEAGGALLARCFTESLDALEEFDEIPF